MANEIKSKFSASTAMTMSVASLASSASGLGRQSDMVDNSSNRYPRIIIYAKVQLGATSTTTYRGIAVYLIRGDKDATTPHRTDDAAATGGSFQVRNAEMIGNLTIGPTSNAAGYLYGSFVFDDPGPEWGIAMVNETGATLGVGALNYLRFVGVIPEVQ